MSLVTVGNRLVSISAINRIATGLLASCIVSVLMTGAAIAQGKPAAASPKPSGVQPMPRGSFVATMDGEYRRIDANKDGVVTKAELEADQTRQAVAAATARARALFSRFDLDRNGQLSADEFIRAAVNQPKKPDVSLLMSRLDKDRDNKVTVVEYRALTLAGFDKLDTDNDSVLSEAEQRAGGFIR